MSLGTSPPPVDETEPAAAPAERAYGFWSPAMIATVVGLGVLLVVVLGALILFGLAGDASAAGGCGGG